MRRRNARTMLTSGVLLLALLLLALPASAQQQVERIWKARAGEEIVVPAGEIIQDDLYVAGNRIRIDGRVEGDLFAAGQQVEVNGAVAGDVVAAGNSITIRGPVAGDVRAAGATIDVSSTVREDLVAAAGLLTVAPGARIGGDVVFGTGETRLQGDVAGNVLGQTSGYTQQGTVAGRETVTIEEREPPVVTQPTLLDRLLDAARRYVGIVLFGALLLWLVPRRTEIAEAMVRQRPLPSLGFGLLSFVGYLVALIVLALAAIIMAIPLGLLGFGGLVATAVVGALLASGVLTFTFVVAAAFLASAVVGLALGRLLLARTGNGERERPWAALLLGVLILVVLFAIPVLGGLAGIVVALLGLGAIILAAQQIWQGRALGVAASGGVPGATG